MLEKDLDNFMFVEMKALFLGGVTAPPKRSAMVYGSPEVSLKRAVNSLTPFLAQVSR